jgi:hypothetical protein
MSIRTAEPVFLVPGLDSSCEPPGSGWAFAAVELVFVLGVAVLGPVFALAGLELVGPPVNSDWARAPAVPVLLESELVCALAGKASITAKRGTITRLQRCLGEASRHMSAHVLTLVAQRPALSTLYKPSALYSFLTFTTKQPPMSSADHGGGKRRGEDMFSTIKDLIPPLQRANLEFERSSFVVLSRADRREPQG